MVGEGRGRWGCRIGYSSPPGTSRRVSHCTDLGATLFNAVLNDTEELYSRSFTAFRHRLAESRFEGWATFQDRMAVSTDCPANCARTSALRTLSVSMMQRTPVRVLAKTSSEGADTTLQGKNSPAPLADISKDRSVGTGRRFLKACS